MTARVLRSRAQSAESTDLRTEDLDPRIVLVHLDGELDERFDVLVDRVRLSSLGVDGQIRLIAYSPQSDRVEQGAGVCASPQVAVDIVHVVDPAARQVGPVCLVRKTHGVVRRPRQARLDHALGTGPGQKGTEGVQLVERQKVLLTPRTSLVSQRPSSGGRARSLASCSSSSAPTSAWSR